MATKNSIEHKIDPAHLLYHTIKGHPLIRGLTELDILILAALCVFLNAKGEIKMVEKDRIWMQSNLQVSPQQLSNNIKRLKQAGILHMKYTPRAYGKPTVTRGMYLLDAQLHGLIKVPKRLTKSFTVKFIIDELATRQHSENGF